MFKLQFSVYCCKCFDNSQYSKSIFWIRQIFSTFASTKNLHYYLPAIIFLILKYGVDTKAIVNLFSYKKEGSYFCRKILFTLRSSHRWCSVKKGVLSNFAKFTGKHLCQSFFFNKVIKKETGTGVFLWILRNFSEHLF